MKAKRIGVGMISILFVLLFVYAAASKSMDFEKFSLQLHKSPLLTRHAGLMVWTVPLTEIGIALMLLSERFRLLGLYSSFSLMVMFTGYIFIITRFSPDTPCSCGGVLQHLSWDQHLVFNLGFVALGALGVILYPPDKKHTPQKIE
jgi:uncharacterized membrane protein YphA (DoxX/SURF4 family)